MLESKLNKLEIIINDNIIIYNNIHSTLINIQEKLREMFDNLPDFQKFESKIFDISIERENIPGELELGKIYLYSENRYLTPYFERIGIIEEYRENPIQRSDLMYIWKNIEEFIDEMIEFFSQKKESLLAKIQE